MYIILIGSVCSSSCKTLREGTTRPGGLTMSPTGILRSTQPPLGIIREVLLCITSGLFIGLIVGTAQQYLSHFIYHAKAMLQHYEPPIGYNQWTTFIRETKNLDSFKSGLKSRMQLGAATGALSIASQVAVFRHFNSGWSANFGGF